MKKGAKANRGEGLDIHKAIGNLPQPKGEFTLPGHKYTGPYNPLGKQLDYDPQTDEILKYRVKPMNQIDEIASRHDVCYDMGKSKGDCNKKMLDEMWNMKAKNAREQLDRAVKYPAIWAKHNLSLGLEPRRLQEESADELHKEVRRKFTRRRVIVRGVDEVRAADLVHMQIFAR